MRRCILYLLIAAAALAIPVERADVADLHPVQTVALYKTQEGYRIETDTEDYGQGETVAAAYHDLLRSTPGIIYLDTADFLLVSSDTLDKIPEIRIYLKSGVRSCQVTGSCDLKTASKFLSVHGDLPSVFDWKQGMKLPVLDCSPEQIKFL